MYHHKFAHFCGCLQEHFVLPKFGQELSMDNAASNKKKMTRYNKKQHKSIFIGQMGCGKTHLVLELIQKEYKKHFDYIVIICPTLQENDTYHVKELIKNDDKVWLVDPKDNLYQWIK